MKELSGGREGGGGGGVALIKERQRVGGKRET